MQLSQGRRLGQSHLKRDDNYPLRTKSLNRALLESNAAPLDNRVLVVAVGSNASPEVMFRKLRNFSDTTGAVVPFVSGIMKGIAVGHSAHCSKQGYIAAAPYSEADAEMILWASWLDRTQLKVLDETEPNYRRIQVSSREYPYILENGETPEYFYVYESLWGLLGDDGVCLPLLGQPDLFLWMNSRSANCPIEFGGDPQQVQLSLRTTQAQEDFRCWLVEEGFVLPSRLIGTDCEPLSIIHNSPAEPKEFQSANNSDDVR